MNARDHTLWKAAKPWLNVRSNDEHTLISYALGQALLALIEEADEAVVLPAILLHDTGWKGPILNFLNCNATMKLLVLK
jgi:CRISPR/Cas system-associated endonuclease Cas3-HD